MQYEIFDMHVHVFPDAIARKAVRNLGLYYEVPMAADGTLAAFQKSLAEAPEITECLIHSTATAAHQVENVNTFVASLISDKLYGFGSMHPDYPDIEKEIDRMQAMGLRGIKRFLRRACIDKRFQNKLTAKAFVFNKRIKLSVGKCACTRKSRGYMAMRLAFHTFLGLDFGTVAFFNGKSFFDYENFFGRTALYHFKRRKYSRRSRADDDYVIFHFYDRSFLTIFSISQKHSANRSLRNVITHYNYV